MIKNLFPLFNGCISLTENAFKIKALSVFLFIAFVSVPVSAFAAVSSSDTISYYPLNGASLSATGVFDLTDSGVNFVTGKHGLGADLLLTTSLVRNTSPITGNGNWTFQAGFKTSNTGTFKWIAEWGNSSQAVNQFIYVYMADDRSLRVELPANSLINYSSTFYDDGQYHLLHLTKNGDIYNFYIDGTLLATASHSGTNFGSDYLAIGRDAINNRYSWGNGIDEVGFYNRHLTNAEITQIYNSGNWLQYPYTNIPVAPNATTTRYVAATLASSLPLIIDPVTTISYSYASPETVPTNKQGAVIMISHIPSVTPSVMWGSENMSLLDTSPTALAGYKTSYIMCLPLRMV